MGAAFPDDHPPKVEAASPGEVTAAHSLLWTDLLGQLDYYQADLLGGGQLIGGPPPRVLLLEEQRLNPSTNYGEVYYEEVNY